MKNWKSYILFALLSIGVFLPNTYIPLLQKQFPALQAQPLNKGAEISPPNFWPSLWMNKSYQKNAETFLKDNSPAASFFLRMKSQIDYQYFNEITLDKILVGKEGHFFPKKDCDAYIGKDFIGKSKLNSLAQKLKFIIDHYKNKNIPFLILIPPAKPGLHPELLPEFYKNYPIDSTNRIVFRSALDAYDIPYIDFDFLKNHSKDQYPIIAQGSLHWSPYGFGIAADSISTFIQSKFGLSMPRMTWKDQIEMKIPTKGMEVELINGAHFMYPPQLDPTPYPNFRYSLDSGQQKTKALSISDSYYLALWDHQLHQNLFAAGSLFFYYNRDVKPKQFVNGTEKFAHEFDRLKLIESHDMVIMTAYDANMYRFGFGFIEEVYEKLTQ